MPIWKHILVWIQPQMDCPSFFFRLKTCHTKHLTGDSTISDDYISVVLAMFGFLDNCYNYKHAVVQLEGRIWLLAPGKGFQNLFGFFFFFSKLAASHCVWQVCCVWQWWWKRHHNFNNHTSDTGVWHGDVPLLLMMTPTPEQICEWETSNFVSPLFGEWLLFDFYFTVSTLKIVNVVKNKLINQVLFSWGINWCSLHYMSWMSSPFLTLHYSQKRFPCPTLLRFCVI